MFELMDAYSQSAIIKVIGVGGGGRHEGQHCQEYEFSRGGQRLSNSLCRMRARWRA